MLSTTVASTAPSLEPGRFRKCLCPELICVNIWWEAFKWETSKTHTHTHTPQTNLIKQSYLSPTARGKAANPRSGIRERYSRPTGGFLRPSWLLQTLKVPPRYIMLKWKIKMSSKGKTLWFGFSQLLVSQCWLDRKKKKVFFQSYFQTFFKMKWQALHTGWRQRHEQEPAVLGSLPTHSTALLPKPSRSYSRATQGDSNHWGQSNQATEHWPGQLGQSNFNQRNVCIHFFFKYLNLQQEFLHVQRL